MSVAASAPGSPGGERRTPPESGNSRRGKDLHFKATIAHNSGGSNHDSPLRQAQERLGIAWLWRVLDLPGEAGRSCRCPFHADRSNSFSVFTGPDGRERWKCFAGCGEGDSTAFLATARNLNEGDAARQHIELAGLMKENEGAGSSRAQASARSAKGGLNDSPEKAGKRAKWPRTESTYHPQQTREDIEALASLRGLLPHGVAEAWDRGLLRFYPGTEGRAWVVTDRRGINGQRRLLSGRKWRGGQGPKALTLPGSVASWPIGLYEAARFPGIALVEGGPDLLAAFHLAWVLGCTEHVAPVAMLGASNHLPAEALPHFRGKAVRIFVHDDKAGLEAARRWAGQLREKAAHVDGFTFDGYTLPDGRAVKDLNDFVLLDRQAHEAAMREAFDFVNPNRETA